MSTSEPADRTLFEDDEVLTISIPKTRDQLLKTRTGLVHLNVVSRVLGLPFTTFVRLAKKEETPYLTMGIGKLNCHYIVRLKTFIPWFYSERDLQVQAIPKSWDGNDLINASGIFRLHEVCTHLPWKPLQILYRIRVGEVRADQVWKSEIHSCYLVDMKALAPTLRAWWRREE